MTIEDVIMIVGEESGMAVEEYSKLDDLGMDSLEFLNLIVRVGVPDSLVPRLNTVHDLYLASEGRL